MEMYEHSHVVHPVVHSPDGEHVCLTILAHGAKGPLFSYTTRITQHLESAQGSQQIPTIRQHLGIANM